MRNRVIVEGFLVNYRDGDNDDCLGILVDGYVKNFIEYLQKAVYQRKLNVNDKDFNSLTFRWHITNERKNIDDLKLSEMYTAEGYPELTYFHRYSEYTGYLWTQQEFTVGNHDILEEITSALYEDQGENKSKKFRSKYFLLEIV